MGKFVTLCDIKSDRVTLKSHHGHITHSLVESAGQLVHRPSGLCISRQINKARTLTSSLCQTLIKSSWLNSNSELAL